MELIILKILRPVPLARTEKGPVRQIDTFQGNTFYHEGHEGHEEVAIRLIAHRGTEGTEGGDIKLKDKFRTKQDGQDLSG